MKNLMILLIAVFYTVCSNAQFSEERALYVMKAEKYKRMKTTGTVLTIAGGILGTVGLYRLASTPTKTTTNAYGQQQEVMPAGPFLTYLAGVAMVGAGIPLWIVGANKEKKYNNKVDSLSLGLNVSPHGAGLSLSCRLSNN